MRALVIAGGAPSGQSSRWGGVDGGDLGELAGLHLRRSTGGRISGVGGTIGPSLLPRYNRRALLKLCGPALPTDEWLLEPLPLGGDGMSSGVVGEYAGDRDVGELNGDGVDASTSSKVAPSDVMLSI